MAIQSVNNVNTANVAAQTKSANKTSAEANKQTDSLATDTDTINISTAEGLKKAVDTGTSGSKGVDETRVAEIKAAIQAGNYKINPDRVAEKMMQLEINIANST
ncbi:flagellar biosynthesis anti-sigma factor FlgM [Methylomonas rivi]|uniref:Negative regulator of flagellin synthesis n=1 Tax=Methylomonas rivi TaxID=2952226 RepID=A0ABT1U4J5_9GAMM|nr:flagellar biosynthesis anti-sigma factor FlgM [Methylomonas sp. WSC-6]MBS4052357.1 flagellar biosynthesis anti-sigma factor FlgM [Methylomonas sp.]MCQ8128767.1 flagellar biosynthesis anti-sigma factor FlgM [Methylomonas sp. WSC-6]